MDKNAIKKYAIWARRELIERVAQRAAMYGITEKDHGDPEAESVDGRLLSPVEKRQRKALIQKIADKGYQQVIEEVAYTWFNRFAALRFMEVNGYLPTHIRVFTNDANEFKPQILSEAIHLELEGLNRNRVYELENENKREELFKYLLTVQCNALNEILPGMFQKIEDYTELLLPDNLLRQGSVIEQMITMIPEADWTDQVQIIGWLYQYYNTEPKDKVFADLKKNIKITKENIPAATQLFTPDWIVHYMVENSLGRLWLEGKSEIRNQKSETEREATEKRLAEEKGWKYYLPEAPQEPDVQAQLNEIRKEYASLKPEEIKVIDPCMGSGHILCVLFDVLVQIYEDYGYSAREAAVSIVENNLWGLDIDDRAAQLAYFAVMMKARQYDRRFFTRKIQPHVYAIEESNGITSIPINDVTTSLTQTEYNIAIKQTKKLIKEMYDAKEYGSIINVTPCDWKLLRRFTISEAKDVQLSLDIQGDNKDLVRLQSLINIGEILTQRYQAVVTNPPYMGSSNMGSTLSNYVKKYYPKTKYDMSTVFMERTLKMCDDYGFMSMINIPVWMFLSSFEKLRNELLQTNCIDSMSHFGRGVFGSDFGSTAFCIRKCVIPNYSAIYIKLYDRQGEVESITEKERKFLSKKGRYSRKQELFLKLPGTQIAYWIPDAIFDAFSSEKNNKLQFFTRSGLTTGDNDLFLKMWYEINFKHLFMEKQKEDIIPAWYPHLKGGEFRKWYGDYDFVIHYDLKSISEMKKCPGFRHDGKEFFFKESITWSKTTAGPLSARINYSNTTFNTAGCCLFAEGEEKYALAALNSSVSSLIMSFLCPSLSYAPGDVAKVPIILSDKKDKVEYITSMCIQMSKEDWDSFETSWDFKTHPMVSWSHGLWDVTAIMCSIHTYLGRDTIVKSPIEASWLLWKIECDQRFKQLKANEEELNRIFIDIYGLQDELTPEVADRDVTVRRADLQRDIRSFISYAVGCMFGRYSLDKEGLVFAGGNFDDIFSKRKEYLAMDYYNPDEPPAKEYICLKPEEGNNIQLTYSPDKDNVLPICDDEYFADDIVGRFVKFVERVYGKDSLEDNLRFIADALGGKGAARDVIRNYFLNDFYADHLKVYQKRPIYWLFDSGKKNGFKCLIYMHRYQPDTIARIRTDYIHEQQSRYRTAIADLEQRVNGASTSDRVKLSKQLTKLRDQAEELRVYEEKIHHLADQMIKINLDDGVKVNYAKFQDVLAPIK